MKQLLLGTAQWGWTVSRDSAFELLDAWLKAGFTGVDTATNYPINKNTDQFRAAEKILHEYIQAHGLSTLNITMKIGAMDNLFSPESNLAPSFIQMAGAEYRRLFGENLQTLMLHWDNRDDQAAIEASLSVLQAFQLDYGIKPGLSGIRYPDIYAKANLELNMDFDIQLKHNPLQSSYPHYAPLQQQGHRFYAYGINAGGVKLDGNYSNQSTLNVRGKEVAEWSDRVQQLSAYLSHWNTSMVRPPVRTMNHLGLIYATLHPDFSGIILGVNAVDQLNESLDFYKNLSYFDYEQVYKDLSKKG